MRRLFPLLFLAALLLQLPACRGEERPAPSAPQPRPAVAPAPSYDDRELAALRGAGHTIQDVRAPRDTGVNIADAEAALFDEALCRKTCGHLFRLLLEEQREKLAKDPAALAIFEEDLATARPKREKRCVAECRRYADRRAYECVMQARDRAQLDRCDF